MSRIKRILHHYLFRVVVRFNAKQIVLWLFFDMVSMSIMSKSNTVGNEFGKFRTLCILILTSIFLQENALTSAFSPFPSIARLPHRPAPRFFNNSTKIVMDRLSTVMKTQSLDDDEEEPVSVFHLKLLLICSQFLASN